MYGVIRYYNSRLNVSFKIIKLCIEYIEAKEYAFELAEEDYGVRVVERVIENYIEIYDEIISYTTGNGYNKNVYSVIEIK